MKLTDGEAEKLLARLDMVTDSYNDAKKAIKELKELLKESENTIKELKIKINKIPIDLVDDAYYGVRFSTDDYDRDSWEIVKCSREDDDIVLFRCGDDVGIEVNEDLKIEFGKRIPPFILNDGRVYYLDDLFKGGNTNGILEQNKLQGEQER